MKKIRSLEVKNYGQLLVDDNEKELSKSCPSGYFLLPGKLNFIEKADRINERMSEIWD